MIRFRRLRFPDAAGEHQRSRASASLIRELGDNYGRYHEFLGRALEEAGGRPDPDDYASFEAYLAAWTLVEEIVEAEVLLRRSEGFRKRANRLDAPLNASIPLVDSDDRLVSIES